MPGARSSSRNRCCSATTAETTTRTSIHRVIGTKPSSSSRNNNPHRRGSRWNSVVSARSGFGSGNGGRMDATMSAISCSLSRLSAYSCRRRNRCGLSLIVLGDTSLSIHSASSIVGSEMLANAHGMKVSQSERFTR